MLFLRSMAVLPCSIDCGSAKGLQCREDCIGFVEWYRVTGPKMYGMTQVLDTT